VIELIDNSAIREDFLRDLGGAKVIEDYLTDVCKELRKNFVWNTLTRICCLNFLSDEFI
jgi:hypothetical protein